MMRINFIDAKFLAVSLFALAFCVSQTTLADEMGKMNEYTPTCKYLPLVTQFIKGVKNDTSCVDAPVALEKVKAVFNLGEQVNDDKGRPVGLRHMFMFGTALQKRIAAGKLDPKNVSVIGVMHGSGLDYALNDTTTDVAKGFIDKIFALNKAGVNINLEVCGVTLQGRGKTNEDLYDSNGTGIIHVDQGAVARIIDLEQRGYAYWQE
jgi:intracellular sulfur oxidation DsrE/DsrF family protein